MATTIIEVNTSTLKTDVSSIETEIKALRTAATKIKDISTQLGAMWDGPAKIAFMAAVQDDLSQLENLIIAIEKFTQLTDESRSEYDKCEQSVAQIVASIRV